MNVAEKIKQLSKDAEEIRNTEPQVLPTCSDNDSWAQGDVIIQKLSDEFVKTLELVKTKPAVQLAPGETKGSRHCLSDKCKSDAGIEFYKLSVEYPLVGPIMKCPNGIEVEHPEHGDIKIEEGGWYGVRYQQLHGDELRRQAD